MVALFVQHFYYEQDAAGLAWRSTRPAVDASEGHHPGTPPDPPAKPGQKPPDPMTLHCNSSRTADNPVTVDEFGFPRWS